ncbi:hypothetical protein ABZX40_19850 [Streptomyces sp. NPDC004610]|uniref:hypothetical protein n=1 Tax=unclassified Streptomyces TaxID=2593676 RepID=UPI0033B9B7FA
MGDPFDPRPARARERSHHRTKLAALIGPGDVIAYDGKWRTVRTTGTDRGPMGGLAVVVVWEDGGTVRFPAGDGLLVRDSDSG